MISEDGSVLYSNLSMKRLLEHPENGKKSIERGEDGVSSNLKSGITSIQNQEDV